MAAVSVKRSTDPDIVAVREVYCKILYADDLKRIKRGFGND